MLVQVSPRLLFTGVSVILLSSFSTLLLNLGESIEIWSVGLGSVVIVLAYLVLLRLGQLYWERGVWEPQGNGDGAREEQTRREQDRAQSGMGRADDTGEQAEFGSGLHLRAALWRYIAAVLILVAGVTLSSAADTIATLTGLGATLVGSIFVGISTSLPDMVVAVSAVRRRHFNMAVGGVFGSCLNNLIFILVVDVVYRGAPIADVVSPAHTQTALLGILLAAIAVAGLIYRSTQGVLRLGIDTVAIIVVYLGGVFLLFAQSAQLMQP